VAWTPANAGSPVAAAKDQQVLVDDGVEVM